MPLLNLPIKSSAINLLAFVLKLYHSQTAELQFPTAYLENFQITGIRHLKGVPYFLT